MEDRKFEEWAILELMGHRKVAGLVKEETIGGASFIRIDIPDKSGEASLTQFYSPSAVYCITPTTKEIVTSVVEKYSSEPIARWEIRTALPEPNGSPDFDPTEDFGPDHTDEVQYLEDLLDEYKDGTRHQLGKGEESSSS